ncbi:hypothetical protein TCSYLVIO_009789 [Trypanosoma cruzi]|uniref:MPN domain-containing protein n=1 Tax=Trypanosoma cruzi TaxID=5693 RepID=A0A2V2V4E3_TRYCR|nr:hypothetical protein TCSYLVIO_009789 [Trypanosoma cruzi]KAF8289238.1 putative Uncharacterized protein family (UPF0172) [Trypanosoma cruzi]PBJ74416.1 hypothetical protein BCY84_12668 [Trypanosoma cruzi cruzi]PWU91081.1 hypothetical protein C4B63_45g230 [Trypanosoma cruzi]RNF16435.1 hypothetical protein TcG_06195 [Trypanosoma cruzi]
MSSSSTPSVVSSVEAHAKALLHCQKYPTQAVSGFLIGKRLTESGASDSVFVADAVPLFHTIMMTHPHPMLSVAYAQVSSYARTKGLVLLGYYVANERAGDSCISPLTTNVLRMLHDKVSTGHNPLLWTIVGANRAEGVDVRPSYYMGGKNYLPAPELTFGRWNSDTLSCEAITSNTEAVEVFENAVDAFKQFQLVDFEDHLERVQLNYLEQTVQV